MNRILQRIAFVWAFESRLPCPRVVRRQVMYRMLASGLCSAPAGITVEAEPAERPPRPMGFRRGVPIKIMRSVIALKRRKP